MFHPKNYVLGHRPRTWGRPLDFGRQFLIEGKHDWGKLSFGRGEGRTLDVATSGRDRESLETNASYGERLSGWF